MSNITVESLVNDRFTRRMAREYVARTEREEQSPLFSGNREYMEWCHERGFMVESASAYHLSEQNISDYLSDYDIYRVWPLNNWERIWINDKLTLKYMLAGTPLDRYLPKYYFYNDGSRLVPLIDSGLATEPSASNEAVSGDEFLAVLREHGAFACKPCNGTRGAGFHKLGYEGGSYFVDNLEADAQAVLSYVDSHPNDVFTEFIRSGNGMESITPVMHTLRVLVVNETGRAPKVACGYLRVATDVFHDDSKSNFDPNMDALNRTQTRSFNVDVDMTTGEFGIGKLIYGNKIEDDVPYPDTGEYVRGGMRDWDKVMELVYDVSMRIGPLEYLGYDVTMSDDGPKLIEINSNPGIKYTQAFAPYWKNEIMSEFIRRKLAALDAMDESALARRREIAR